MLPNLPLRSISAIPASRSLVTGRLRISASARYQASYPLRSQHLTMATAYSSAPRLRLRRTCPPGTRIASVRRLHRSSSVAYPPTKEGQDKDSLTPRSTEYSKSGGDDAAAATSKTAFDPNQTAPETENKNADAESGQVNRNRDVNPLDVSPANQGVSQPRDSTEGGAQSSSGESSQSQSSRQRTSGKGSAPKSGGVKHGG